MTADDADSSDREAVAAATWPVAFGARQKLSRAITHDSHDFLVMGDPFETYNEEVEEFMAKPRPAGTSCGEEQF